MIFRLAFAVLAIALAFAGPASAQVPTAYSLIDSAQAHFQVGVFQNSGNSKIFPGSVSVDASGNPLSGTAGVTNTNGAALYVQGVTGGLPIPMAFASPQHIICDSGCSTGGGGGLSVAFAGPIGANGTPVGFKDASGNFQPLLGDVTNGQWVSIKASVALPVTGTFFQATQPISAVSLPLPTGAATQTTLAALLTALGTPFQAGASIGNTAFGISGTLPAFATTPTVNLGTIGTAATAALQTTGNTSLASIDTKTPALGQALAASSVPVVLTAAQLATLTPPSSVTVTQATGTNLHMVCDSGCSSSSSPSFGSAFPSTGTPIGMTQGGNLTALSGTGGALNINISSGSIANTSFGISGTLPAYAATPTFKIDQTTPGTTNGVQVNSSALPTGAATSANQSSQITQETATATALGTPADAVATAPASTSSATVVALLKALLNTGQYPSGATALTASATGTTAATTATLAGAVGKTTYICGLSIRANATAAVTGNATVTGTITGTLNFTQWTAPAASGLGVTEQIFNPCVPASATNTSIAVVSAPPGTGGVVSSTAWGYQL